MYALSCPFLKKPCWNYYFYFLYDLPNVFVCKIVPFHGTSVKLLCSVYSSFSLSFSSSIYSPFSISSLSLCCHAVGNSLDAQPNRILLVTIHHMLYPITVDVLFQVFSPHGSVEKIVTFQKSAGQIFRFLPFSSFLPCQHFLYLDIY